MINKESTKTIQKHKIKTESDNLIDRKLGKIVGLQLVKAGHVSRWLTLKAAGLGGRR